MVDPIVHSSSLFHGAFDGIELNIIDIVRFNGIDILYDLIPRWLFHTGMEHADL